jgi:hypothetical protein
MRTGGQLSEAMRLDVGRKVNWKDQHLARSGGMWESRMGGTGEEH